MKNEPGIVPEVVNQAASVRPGLKGAKSRAFALFFTAAPYRTSLNPIVPVAKTRSTILILL